MRSGDSGPGWNSRECQTEEYQDRCGNNLPAPTSEHAIIIESSPGALGIPESMPPDGDETFIVAWGLVQEEIPPEGIFM